MRSSYEVRVIDILEREKLMEHVYELPLRERKADIDGLCVKIMTNVDAFKEMFEDNFYSMSEGIRPHVRLYVVNDGTAFSVLYEPISHTVFIMNCDYYGWIKSITLAAAADLFEEYYSVHRRYAVHGSLVDKGGRGIALIGTPGSGKTTLTYGLLIEKKHSFVADDWFFTRLMGDDVMAYSSEKNSYVRADLANLWPSLASLLEKIRYDLKGRAIVDVRMLFGSARIRESSVLKAIILLKRDKSDPSVISRISSDAALKFMLANDFCNPHQLIRDERKTTLRAKFMKALLDVVPTYLLNTTETPSESLGRVKEIAGSI